MGKETENPEMGTEDALRIVESMEAELADDDVVDDDVVDDDELTANEPNEADEADEDSEGEDVAAPVNDDFEVELVVGGESVKLPLKELKDGYLRQSDYSKKTMALAEERKDVANERVRATRPEILQDLMAVDPIIVQAHNTDWDYLRQTDPAEWVARQQEYNARVADWNGVLEQSRQSIAERDLAQKNEIIAVEHEALVAAIPELQKPEVREQVLSAVLKVGADYGMSPQDMDAITDHRIVKMAYDLSKARERDAALKGLKTGKAIAPSIRPNNTTQKAVGKQSQTDPNVAKLAKLAASDKGAEAKLLQKLFG